MWALYSLQRIRRVHFTLSYDHQDGRTDQASYKCFLAYNLFKNPQGLSAHLPGSGHEVCNIQLFIRSINLSIKLESFEVEKSIHKQFTRSVRISKKFQSLCPKIHILRVVSSIYRIRMDATCPNFSPIFPPKSIQFSGRVIGQFLPSCPLVSIVEIDELSPIIFIRIEVRRTQFVSISIKTGNDCPTIVHS